MQGNTITVLDREAAEQAKGIRERKARQPVPFDQRSDVSLIRANDLVPILGFSPATLWRRVKAGTFPAPVKLSERVTAWLVKDVREWIAGQFSTHGAA